MAPFHPGRQSLKTTLATYFIPISVLPALFVSIYATRLFEETSREALIQKARTERQALVSEMDALEKSVVADATGHGAQSRLVQAVASRNESAIRAAIAGYRKGLQVRLYAADGGFLVSRVSDKQQPYISSTSLSAVKKSGMTVARYLTGAGIQIIVRQVLRDKFRLYGILEEEYVVSQDDLADFKSRRQVDVVLLSHDFHSVAGSFALSPEALQSVSKAAFSSTFSIAHEPVYVRLGDARFATFLYSLPDPISPRNGGGYFAVFIPMVAIDAIVSQLKLTMIYVTATLILLSALLIFFVSRRLVRPVEHLVVAMKRMKSGRAEQIPEMDTTHEIEYLVRSFNEMSRNIGVTKRALELKLDELKKANDEIKDAQSHLIQSAKMASLGQLVAGVAHELNNPIAFIYSNMLHLNEYVDKLKQLVSEYRKLQSSLSSKEREKIRGLERDLEVDYILTDMGDLTASCVDGANRTKEIVLGLRTFSRMEESTFRKVDIHEGLRSTIRLVVTEFKDRVQIHEEFGELPLVECNLSQVNQVFMNLITNAAQAIERSGDIWIRTRLEGQDVAIEIEDNGGGIPPDIIEKIFDPFFTTKKVGKGTGLGLSIAYGLIQKHNGSITVDSQVGRGTRFTVKIPVLQAAAQTA